MKYINIIIVIIIWTQISTIHCLTCDEILEEPADKKISLSELQSVQPKDMVLCIAHLGKEQLSPPEADLIWRSIITYYNGSESVPDSVLMLLHWVTTAVKPEDYANISFNDIDVIQNFGMNYNLNEEQLAAIADRVRGEKEPERYTYYDLTALNQILCAFNQSEIERIHPSAYREAATSIGKLEHCSSHAMSGFATLAVQKEAFGPPGKWTEAIIQIIGKVADFIPKEFLKNHTKFSAG